jgi:hypothetical protein
MARVRMMAMAVVRRRLNIVGGSKCGGNAETIQRREGKFQRRCVA